MNKKITGYELIKKIQKEEIKSGTHIKYYNKDFDYEGDLYFNGNWFSKEPYYPMVKRYDDIILMLCDKNIMYEILEEDKPIIEKIKIEQDSPTHFYIRNEYGTKCGLTKHSKMIADKLNEVIEFLNRKEDK